jgi:hypothetical protein
VAKWRLPRVAKLGETFFGFFAGLAVARSNGKSIHYEIIVIKHLQQTSVHQYPNIHHSLTQ